MESTVRKSLVIVLVAVLLGTFGALLVQPEQYQAQANEPKSYSLAWVKVLNANTQSAVVGIELQDPGTSDYVSVLTSFPQVFTLKVDDGTLVSQSTRIRTSTFPVADQFFATSKNGQFVVWFGSGPGISHVPWRAKPPPRRSRSAGAAIPAPDGRIPAARRGTVHPGGPARFRPVWRRARRRSSPPSRRNGAAPGRGAP